jgi:hypothetical protein
VNFSAGVEFIDENGSGPGVRLRKSRNEQIRRIISSEFEIRAGRKKALGPRMGLC